jgi:hypothetical protein
MLFVLIGSSALAASSQYTRAFSVANVGSGSISTKLTCPRDVRFTPVSDRVADIAGGPFRAKSCLSEWSRSARAPLAARRPFRNPTAISRWLSALSNRNLPRIGAFDLGADCFPDKGAQPRLSQFVRAGALGWRGVFQ